MGAVVVKASLLLVAWLAATATGVVLALHDATSILGLLLLVAILFGAFAWVFLALRILDTPDGGPEFGVGLVCVLVGAVIVLTCMALTNLGPAYHTRYGERADVFITELTENTTGVVHCRIALSATEQDLGWLDGKDRGSSGCAGHAAGDRIEASVDPHGWVTPVSVDRLGSERSLLITLAIFVAVIVVFIITLIATAATARPARI